MPIHNDNLNHPAKQGITRFLSDYLNVCPGESVVFFSDGAKEELVELLVFYAEEIGAFAIHHLNSNPFSQIAKHLDKCDVAILLETTSSTYRQEIIDYLSEHKGFLRIARVFDFSLELFTHTFNVEKNVLRTLHKNLINLASTSREICVKSLKGTDLEIQLDDRFGWIDSCGQFSESKPAVFPVAEIATYSPNVTGVLVADGAINTNFGFYTDPRLIDMPVTMHIENSIVRYISCANPILHYFLNRYIGVPFCNRVGEVGIGTNFGITEFVPFLSHINERYPALHLGFGANNQGKELVGWNCDFHLDLILDHCDIRIGSSCVLSERKFLEIARYDSPVPRKLQVAHADTI